MCLHIKKLRFLGCSCIAPNSARPKLTTLLRRKLVALVADIVALVDSCAIHSFVAANLVQKYQLTIILGTSMIVTLADGSQVTTSETCSIPIITCTMSNKPVYCLIKCRILPQL